MEMTSVGAESKERRKRALLVSVAGVLLVTAATCVAFQGGKTVVLVAQESRTEGKSVVTTVVGSEESPEVAELQKQVIARRVAASALARLPAPQMAAAPQMLQQAATPFGQQQQQYLQQAAPNQYVGQYPQWGQQQQYAYGGNQYYAPQQMYANSAQPQQQQLVSTPPHPQLINAQPSPQLAAPPLPLPQPLSEQLKGMGSELAGAADSMGALGAPGGGADDDDGASDHLFKLFTAPDEDQGGVKKAAENRIRARLSARKASLLEQGDQKGSAARKKISPDSGLFALWESAGSSQQNAAHKHRSSRAAEGGGTVNGELAASDDSSDDGRGGDDGDDTKSDDDSADSNDSSGEQEHSAKSDGKTAHRGSSSAFGADDEARSESLARIVDAQDGAAMDINMPPEASKPPPPPATSRDAYGIPMGGAAVPV